MKALTRCFQPGLCFVLSPWLWKPMDRLQLLWFHQISAICHVGLSVNILTMFCEQLFATLDLNCCNPQYSWVSNMCCNVEYLLIVLFVLLLPARPGIDLILDVFWNAEIIESGLGGAAAVCSRCSTAAAEVRASRGKTNASISFYSNCQGLTLFQEW